MAAFRHCIFCLLITAQLGAVEATAQSELFGNATLLNGPTLLNSQDARLCKSLLDALQWGYLSEQTHIEIRYRPWSVFSDFESGWIKWEDIGGGAKAQILDSFNESDNRVLILLPVSNRNGRKPLNLYVLRNHGKISNVKRAIEKLMSDPKARSQNWETWFEATYKYSYPTKVDRQFDGTDAFFYFDGAVYFYDGDGRSDLARKRIYQLQPRVREPSEICSARLYPADTEQALVGTARQDVRSGSPWTGENSSLRISDRLEGLRELSRLYKEISDITGLFDRNRVQWANEAKTLIYYRPWAVPYYNGISCPTVVMDGLRGWGLSGPWEQEKLRRILTRYGYAHRALRKHYDSLNLPRNPYILTENAMAYLMNAHFPGLRYDWVCRVGRSTFDADKMVEEISADRNAEESELVRAAKIALLAGSRTPRQLPDILRRISKIPGDLLIAAVIRANFIDEILDRGVDVNYSNQYGKTALMFAAQLNKYFAVDLLLNRGADPNLGTVRGENRVGPQRIGRTALMYAAQFSEEKVISRLLCAGSDPQAADSRGFHASDYLQRSKIMSRQDEVRDKLAAILDADIDEAIKSGMLTCG